MNIRNSPFINSKMTMQYSNICHWIPKNRLYEMWEQYTLSSSKSHDHIYWTISQHNDTNVGLYKLLKVLQSIYIINHSLYYFSEESFKNWIENLWLDLGFENEPLRHIIDFQIHILHLMFMVIFLKNGRCTVVSMEWFLGQLVHAMYSR